MKLSEICQYLKCSHLSYTVRRVNLSMGNKSFEIAEEAHCGKSNCSWTIDSFEDRGIPIDVVAGSLCPNRNLIQQVRVVEHQL